jgi:hypothetical protein
MMMISTGGRVSMVASAATRRTAALWIPRLVWRLVEGEAHLSHLMHVVMSDAKSELNQADSAPKRPLLANHEGIPLQNPKHANLLAEPAV